MSAMLGALINAGLVIAGALIGLLIRKGVPEKISDTVMKGLGLCVMYIGISGAFEGENTLVLIVATVIGAVIGELIDLDAKVKRLGDKLQAKFAKNSKNGSFAEGFVSATLLFCAGAMAVIGPLESGLQGDHSTQITKGVMDFVSAIIFASTMGIGVAFSAVSVLVYQGAFTLLAVWIEPFLTSEVIAEMSCAGSVILVGLALNMIGITKIKVMNYLPAIFLPILLCMFM